MFSVMLNKINFRFKQIVVHSLIKVGLFFNWPRLVAIAFWLASNKVNPKCRSQYTVLCMGRSVFTDDLKAMATYSGQIKYVTIWRTYFQMVLHHFIKGPEEEKLTEANYHTHDFCKQGKQSYYLFLNKMFPALHKLINFNAVLCGNFGYPDQQEFEEVCAEKKTPYIVLRKEGLASPGSEAGWARMMKTYKFRGTKILFYSEGIMVELLKNGFSNLSDDQFQVVGMPRLDKYFLMRDNKNLKKQAVFFSFYPDDKFLCLINDEEKNKQARKRTEDFHKWVINFAVKHPDIKIIIKTKAADYYVKYVEKILSDNFKENIPNLAIINFGEVSDLIKDSSVVLSFLSTTCLMAIAAGKMLITPYFGDLITDKEWDFFAGYPELVNYAKTEEDLEKYILKSCEHFDCNLPKKNECLEKFLGNSDGRASLRAEEAIIETIEQFNYH